MNAKVAIVTTALTVLVISGAAIGFITAAFTKSSVKLINEAFEAAQWKHA